MSQAAGAENEVIASGDHKTMTPLARRLGTTVFISLLFLIVLTAIPYGTSRPWWTAGLIALIFGLAILWLIEGYLSSSWFGDSWPLMLPLAALALFSFLQTISFGRQGDDSGAVSLPLWNAVSADPYLTRFFVLLLLALTLAGVMLARYASTEQRLRIVINVVIGVAVASAVFGIVRQTLQSDSGFGLALLTPQVGYGQFINRNHFAYLMEMSLGLILGLLLGGGVSRDQALIYFAALLPLWIGLVLCSSRGGLVAMMAQLVVAALLFSLVRRGQSRVTESKALSLTRSLPVRIALILMLVVGVFVGTIWLGGDPLAARIEESRNELTPDAEGLHLGARRNEIWKDSLRMFVANPFFGIGMGGYWAAIPRFHDASGVLTPQEAHNDYLELLASGGLVGFAIGVWFAFVLCKRIRENLAAPNRFRRAAAFGATIGIVGLAVHSLVDFGLHTIVNALVFTTLVVIATSKPAWGNVRRREYD